MIPIYRLSNNLFRLKSYHSLQAGDDINAAIYVLATLLNNASNTEQQLINARQQTFGPTQDITTIVKNQTAPLPRVPPSQHIPSSYPNNSKVPSLPRVPQPFPIPTSTTSFPSPSKPATANIVPSDHKLLHIYDSAGKKQSLDALLKGTDRATWQRRASNEFGRLAQGNRFGTTGTNTIEFIAANQLPPNVKTTYASFVCDIKPFKAETHRVRMVVGGDKLHYDDDAGAPAASLLETKLLINSVVSDASKGAKFMTLDIKDFFLATPMPTPEYMKISLTSVPEDIITQYQLRNLTTPSNHIFIKINKGMYGLKQAAILAYKHLVNNLGQHGYRPLPHTVGLWKHDKRKITFCLCVDDFGIKYFHADDVHHLLTSLRQFYKISPDWSGSQFCGLHLSWNYPSGQVDVSMPSYVPALIRKLNYSPRLPQYSPHPVAPFSLPRPGHR